MYISIDQTKWFCLLLEYRPDYKRVTAIYDIILDAPRNYIKGGKKKKEKKRCMYSIFILLYKMARDSIDNNKKE